MEPPDPKIVAATVRKLEAEARVCEVNARQSELKIGGKEASTWSNLAYAILTEKWAMLRFFVFITGLCFAAIMVWVSVLYIAKKQRLEITQTEKGGVIYRVGSDETLTFLLSASEPWSSTGFSVRQGDSLAIRASGRVCLALHHLVDNVRDHNPPSHPWVAPSGLSANEEMHLGKQDMYRMQYLLVSNAPYGALIAGVGSFDTPPRSTNDIWEVGKSWDGKAPKTGVLWLAVNDVLLRPDTPLGYDVPREYQDTNYKIHGSFSNILSQKYWNVYYDDNIGAFSVTVKRDR